MNYYTVFLIEILIMLTMFKVITLELENYKAKKLAVPFYYNRFAKPFRYQRNSLMIFAAGMTYLFISDATLGSLQWLLEILGLVATATLGDVLSQWLGYQYARRRFKKAIVEYQELMKQIDAAKADPDYSEVVDIASPQYDTNRVLAGYLEPEDHLAIMASDGGKFALTLDNLPPITYLVDLNKLAHNYHFEDKVKITSLTADGQMPFKEEKLDVVISAMANYDKYEMWRILKPGGRLIVEQLGTDNYKEIMHSFIPFRIKGQWDLNSAQETLRQIGFEIEESHEDRGFIRFNSIKALVNFTKGIVPAKVETAESFMSFYLNASKSIKEKSYFDLTTYRFIVVAKKPE